MPGHETGIMGLLDEEAGIPAQDIRPEQILDGIQDFRMADHLVDPGEQHMAAMAYLGLDRAAARGFIILELAAKIGDFAGAQGVDRKMIAALAIAGDLFLVQQSGHWVSSIAVVLRQAAALALQGWRWRPVLSSSGNRARRELHLAFFRLEFAHTIRACGPPT